MFSLALPLFFFFYHGHAQKPAYGVKAGFNYSSILGDLTEGLKFRFSGHAGVFMVFDFPGGFALQPELQYSSQGFQFSSDLSAIEGNMPFPGDNDFRTNVQLNYLNIPVLAKFSLNDKLTLDFGPQFGFLINQVTRIKNLDESNGDVERNSVSGDFRVDYGGVVGLDIQMSERFSLVPRFFIGLRNRLDNFAGDVQNYNAAIQLSLHYRLP
ncbi:MAG: porin family protein [Bacteroidota bacterium]